MSLKFWKYPKYIATGLFAFIGFAVEGFAKTFGVWEEEDEEARADYAHEAGATHPIRKW